MAAIKPIKRSEELKPLSREHHEGLLLCWKIRQGFSYNIDEERVLNYVLYFFFEQLKTHFRKEEELLFDLLEDKDAMKIEALAQHYILNAMIQTMRELRLNLKHSLLQFADELENHIRFEERKLFSYLEEKIDPVLLKTAGNKLKEAELQQHSFSWADTFWINKN